MKNKINNLFLLLYTFAKIGLFTFGGGYAMIPLIIKETSEKKKWIKENEILDIVAISESTPGPIAVNAATFIGFRVEGILGAIAATIGLAIPSFIIIFVISLFYKDLIGLPIFSAMFKGIRVGVILLLISAIIKLSKSVNKNYFSITLFSLSLVTLILLTAFKIDIPFISIALIGVGIIAGISVTAISTRKEKK